MPTVRIALAQLAVAERRFADAEALLDKTSTQASVLAPLEQAEAELMLADALAADGKDAQAREAFARAVELGSHDGLSRTSGCGSARRSSVSARASATTPRAARPPLSWAR